MQDIKETGWCHIAGDKIASISTSETKYINLVKRLKESNPDDVTIVSENRDGSICAWIPVEWIHIKPKSKRNLTDEQKEELRLRLELGRAKAKGEQ